MATATRDTEQRFVPDESQSDSSILNEVIEKTDTQNLSVLAELSRAEIDSKISTAKRYPRSLHEFKRKLMEMATLDEETAGTMFYKVPRDGKNVEGPSVRMAEAVTSCYGNIICGARIVGVDQEFVTAQGFCHDLENNVSNTHEIRRRIVNKYNKRYSLDMIQTTGNAAAAIAFREATFKVVPRSLFKREYEAAKLTSIGKNMPIADQRAGAIAQFQKFGVNQATLLEFLERKGVEDIDIDDLITLRGLKTAIKDGETTIEEVFKKTEAAPEKRVSKTTLADALAEAPKETAPAKKADDPTAVISGEPTCVDLLICDLGGCENTKACNEAFAVFESKNPTAAERLRGEELTNDKIQSLLPARGDRAKPKQQEMA